ncbi:MAG: hypothetical protein ACI4FN_00650 [Acutalibacteraceae bacterium]
MADRNVSFYLERELQKFKTPAVKNYALQMWYKRMYPYIPFESGILADQVSFEEDGIHFKGPQSRYLYYGMLMVSPTTGSSWAKKDERKVLTNKALIMSHEQHPLACAKWGEVAANLHGDVISKEIKEYILSLK